ncbi:MAG: trypsin-like peptidase domain-containing protein, partial [Actinomycetes bacterium]|nr:trypsin-like peptidase domain-containing protein [Actinomycetes bacterium]MDX5380481.1 trypsin-like peptidase domain-containing protein [Actinomycetes bacterium]MDX5399333.1 trypsin-like peptidase domain-containing protein [Actinomycetes bacterium]MDX5450216.1 trypsin-like peptidase domain-containing protein [Actinomycetes bacterium]
RDWGRVGVASLASAVLAAGATWTLANAGEDDAVAAPSPSVAAAPMAEAGDYASVADAVRDSVVAISTASRAGTGLGSGVILDADGNVLTNHHVIAGAEQIQVTLADGRILPAEVVGTDESTDLAVIRIVGAPDDLAAASLGSSEDLVVGQEVMAVGNPLGLSSTVTTGIISALDRPVTTTDSSGPGGTVVVTNAIQVDAAINPGNSGGPVFDMNGRVIGIASSIATLSQGSSGSIGLGFAIPVDLAQRVAGEIIADGAASHAFLGVSMSDAVVELGGTGRTGAQVERVVAGSAAAEAGLQAGDVIVAIDGEPVSGSESLTGYVRQYSPGESVGLEVVRRGTAETVTATLGAMD